MLIILYTMLFLGGSSTAMLGFIADAEDSVKTVKVKDDRQKAALSTLKAIKKRTNARNKQVKRAMKDLNKALGQDDINAADIDAIWGGYFAEVDTYKGDMLDLRWKLKSHINREEWEAISSATTQKCQYQPTHFRVDPFVLILSSINPLRLRRAPGLKPLEIRSINTHDQIHAVVAPIDGELVLGGNAVHTRLVNFGSFSGSLPTTIASNPQVWKAP